MTILLLILFSLDFQHPAIPESVEKRFVVSTLDEFSLGGCMTNPSSGGLGNDSLIRIDWVNPVEPPSMISGSTWIPSGPARISEPNEIVASSQRMIPADPPTPLPVVTTPEPPAVVILTITAAVLLYLLFGRQHRGFYGKT